MTKLIVDCNTNSNVTNCTIVGTIDEDFNQKLFDLEGKTIIFDFNLLESLNSCGIREWIKFINAIKDKRIVYDRCPRLLVDQMNMIKGFLPTGASVRSVYAPFFSPNDEEEVDLLLSLDNFNETILTNQFHPKTKSKLEFDDMPSQYFAFLKSNG
jgi:hypothetical protein